MRLIIARSSNNHIYLVVIAIRVQESGLRESLRDLLEDGCFGIGQSLHVPVSESLSSASDIEFFR